ncbi:MAG TPA: hypothetical protein VFE38_02510 [Edaphobacter sp.]|nr:hypothetical protein [Edaphobacter sp.]
MATTVVAPVSSRQTEPVSRGLEPGIAAAIATPLALFAVLVNGYHPYAEDGGLYMAEIKRRLDPSLYPHATEFVTGHLHFSLFAPFIAALVHLSHASLASVLFAVHVASFWLMLFAASLLAARCFPSRIARFGAVALLAVWMTIPIAGTSLMLMDPYVTARSFSAPCVLLVLTGVLAFMRPLAGSLRERWYGLMLCVAALVAAAAMHVLMAAYGLGCVLVLIAVSSHSRRVRVWGTATLAIAAIGIAGAMQAWAKPESAAYLRVAMTRYYWFLSQWHWYEQLGLAAPLLILAIAGYMRRGKEDSALAALTRMGVVCGGVAAVVALLFARPDMAAHPVARLQPLRILQTVYVVMILLLGALLGEHILKRSRWRWIAAFALLAGITVFTQRQTFPDSAHLELPGKVPQNSWEQAFLWIRKNTPQDAMFALDAHYITSPGEDAQSFRAIAERSMLPDYSKDGGEASVVPELTPAWRTGEIAQQDLNTEPDPQRLARLMPFGVNWIVLRSDAKTGFPCPYVNRAVKVCRLQ